MKLPVTAVVSAAVLVFAFPQASPALAQATDPGAASRSFPLLDGGLSPGSDNRGQSSHEQPSSAERSGDAGSTKGETDNGKAGDTSPGGHRAASHRHSRRFSALGHHRHHFMIHRHGHRVAALNEPGGAG